MGSSLGLAAPLVQFAPDNAAFNFSDYVTVDVTEERARFTRLLTGSSGFQNANPGARIRFRTDATTCLVRLYYNNLVTREDTYNGIGLVFVSGSLHTTFDRAQGPAGPHHFYLSLGSATMRTIEIVMPYCAGVDFLGVSVNSGASLEAPTARPSTRLACIGDSITHGFSATNVGTSWPSLLAGLKDWQLINHGYGGRQVDAADGTYLGQINPSVATYLIGYNNFSVQTPLEAFKTSYKEFVTNFRALCPTVKLYCITPLWTDNTFGALGIDDYRDEIADALTELADANNVLVDGLSLATGSTASFPDSVHPNDAGSAEIAAALESVVVV